MTIKFFQFSKFSNNLGIRSESSQCDSAPSKVFDRLTDFKGIKIINYHTSHDQKQLLLIGNTAKDTNTL